MELQDRMEPDTPWLDPPASLQLGRDEVHVWRAHLDPPGVRIAALKQTLAREERQRAERFRFAHDRNRFIAARGILRTMLGRYLGMDPRTLHFAYNGYGKPVLLDEAEDGPIFFNVSHSQNVALYAFTRSGDIGVDIEQMTNARDYEQMAKQFFSAAEVAELRAVSADQREEAFLNAWTRKEAYIKARGLGLSLPLHLFDVSLTPGAPAQLLANREKSQEHARWSLRELAPGPGFIAALALQGELATLHCWQWPD
jgi:4'-phosphopantetheinyl transferase